MAFEPRLEQKKILQYSGGMMGISAVPGSGKTFTLSALAAKLIEESLARQNTPPGEEPEQEILIVTFSNAAALNFSSRIASFLVEKGLLPGIGYRVCTLHSMALEIIRGHTQQLGIADDFTVLDEAAADALLRQSVNLWLDSDRRDTFDLVIDPKLSPEVQDQRFREKWCDDVTNIVRNVISQAKDYHITPEELRESIPTLEDPFARPLLEMVCDIYSYYQTKLRTYPAMDFADLMFYAAFHRQKLPGTPAPPLAVYLRG